MRAGFSLIEVLAAVALIAIAILPLYGLQRTLADASFRISDTAARVELEQSALDYIAAINPDERPEGTEQIGSWTMRWTSEVIAHDPAPDGVAGTGFYAITLYEVSVELVRPPQTHRFTLRQLGWTQVTDAIGNPVIRTP